MADDTIFLGKADKRQDLFLPMANPIKELVAKRNPLFLNENCKTFHCAIIRIYQKHCCAD